MENPEEILHSLEEFAKLKPKDIPRELEDYLCFVAKTGDPIYQWSAVKSLFKEKLINVITEFYESCPTVEIPPCPNVEMFNYDSMKNFILEKLDTFAAAPFTVQRICELLTTPRKEYNRIDKYMRALEKNILVVSTTEPGNRRNTENGEGIVNGIETEHLTEANSSNDINVEEMDDSPSWPRINQQEPSAFAAAENGDGLESQAALSQTTQDSQESVTSNETRLASTEPSTSNTDSVITCTSSEKSFVSIEPVVTENRSEVSQDDVSVTITAIPAPVQKRRDSIEPLTSDDNAVSNSVSDIKEEEEAPKEVIENKPEISSENESIKSELENVSLTVESDNVKVEGDINEKTIDEECSETSKDIEETSDIKAEEVKISDQPSEEPTPNSKSQNEPETQEPCDNTQSVETAENSIEETNERLSESPLSETSQESEPNVEAVETISNVDKNLILSDDTVDKTAKEDCQEDEVLTTGENDNPVEKEHSDETPMEIDSEENLLKESAIETTSVDTTPN